MLKRTIAVGMTDLREVNLKKLTFPARTRLDYAVID